MGYLTPIMIMNDTLGTIENNPKAFVEQIVDACSRHESPDYYYRGFESAGTRHADEVRLLFIWQNSLTELSKYEKENFENETRINHMEKIVAIAKDRIAEVEKHLKKLKREKKLKEAQETHQ